MNNRKASYLKIFLLLLPGIGGIVLFVLIVLFITFAESLAIINLQGGESGILTFKYWNLVLSNKLFWRFFIYSFRQGFIAAVGTVLIAYPLALWLRKPFTGSRVISGIIRIPMLIPGLVVAFLFLNVIAYHGIINQMLEFIGIIKEPLRMRNDKYGIGIIILQIWKQTPFALLLITGSVRGISTDILDSARDFGTNKINIFRKIIFPLTLPAMRVILILVFIGALGDFSFNATAGPQKLLSISQYMLSLRNNYFEINQAAVVSIMIMVASIIGMTLMVFITKVFEIKRETQA